MSESRRKFVFGMSLAGLLLSTGGDPKAYRGAGRCARLVGEFERIGPNVEAILERETRS